MNLCECRCGEECKNRFVSGHNRRGTTHVCSDETKAQVSNTLLGHSVSAETREKIRLGHIGTVGWKRGKTKETDVRVLKQSQTMRARSPQKEKIKKICECGKCGKVVKTQGSRFLRGHSNGLREKVHLSQETIDKMSASRVHLYHPEWTQEEIDFYLAHKDDLNNFCGCNCGQKCKGKFINGHDRRGKSSWNKGLTAETNPSVARTAEKQKGRVVSEITKEKLRIANTGKNVGKPRSEETKTKIRIKSIGRKASVETREKLKISHTGLKQTDETVEKRIRGRGQKRFAYLSLDGTIVKMRSNWERLYAKHLDSLGIQWKYEIKGFKLSNGKRYFPDFYLPELNEWHEVKGWMSSRSVSKIGLFKKEYFAEKLIIITELKLIDADNFHISFVKDGVLQ